MYQNLRWFLDAERLLDAEGPAEQEGEGDELYGNNFENDYRPIPHLDRYEGAIGTIYFIIRLLLSEFQMDRI